MGIKSTYHERIKEEKRACVIAAAQELFFEKGYARTTLSQIAKGAGLSTGTLFNHFPTKELIFETIVKHFWELDPEWDLPPVLGSPLQGLIKFGRDYACVLTREGMAPLFRVVIAEAKQFPELSLFHYELGEGAVHQKLTQYLLDEVELGNISLPDASKAANEFMSTIAGQVLWPKMLLLDFSISREQAFQISDEAAYMIINKYDS
ncbi:TetR/AcrR family transcriptional regulator [Paenibacillus kyungheensis]|uniref:TetR/AcrR family transcriptional regulator n=1 Tax=Paenibacillus kyungheensis TaxID=1452732 RepID=A0AAX3LVS9_9BACL|nr:TetR/AcrR family transcriptional regulator [Paenibacillus kyungheensis]WCT53798.1 TetR/AcrR family transcriptional regulator [Paenibacillus kyungheensis]